MSFLHLFSNSDPVFPLRMDDEEDLMDVTDDELNCNATLHLHSLPGVQNRVVESLNTIRKMILQVPGLHFKKTSPVARSLSPTRRVGVEPGSVTPFAAINDITLSTKIVIDRKILDGEIVTAHPLHNQATISISGNDLRRFLEECKHSPYIIDLI